MYVPALGSNLPSKGNSFTKAFGRFLLFILRWKIKGEIPNIKKMVVIAAPHSSYWDGIYLVAVKIALGIEVSWLVKSSMFFFPLGILLKYLGAIPVKRDEKKGRVGSIVKEFKKREKLVLAVAPEGTRRNVGKWKTGFYNIALSADVPVLTLFIDYKNRAAFFGKLFHLKGGIEKEIDGIMNYYKSL